MHSSCQQTQARAYTQFIQLNFVSGEHRFIIKFRYIFICVCLLLLLQHQFVSHSHSFKNDYNIMCGVCVSGVYTINEFMFFFLFFCFFIHLLNTDSCR